MQGNSDAHRTAVQYLAAHRVATLATSGSDGPWASAVFYVNDGLDLLFLSSPKSRHMRNIASSGAAAAAVEEDYSDWREIQGVQLEGTVRTLIGPDALAARKAYELKFPIAQRNDATPAAIAKALDRAGWYLLQVRRAYFLCNREQFAKREQIL
jgi:uncharacterized protein YhbP (UPF0306 family)